MEGTEKLHMHEKEEIRNDWNYDATCTLTSLLVLDSENFQHLIFFAHRVHDEKTQNISIRSEWSKTAMSLKKMQIRVEIHRQKHPSRAKYPTIFLK
jgi:hypothetical protein